MNAIVNSTATVISNATFTTPRQDPSAFTAGWARNLPDAERMAVLSKLASNGGIKLPETILPPGTALLKIGEQAKRALQCKLDALPYFYEASAAMRGVIAQQKPLDQTVPVQRLRMTPTMGGIYGEGSNPAAAWAYTEAGFSHMCQLIKPSSVRSGFSENMLALPPALRAQVFNHHATNATRDQQTEKVTLRTIYQHDRRIVRAVTSSRHSLQTGDDLAVLNAMDQHLMEEVLRSAKARFVREPDMSVFEVIWPAMNRQLKVGDIAYIGVRVRNSETKAGALRIEVFVLRVLCYNFTTAFSADLEAEDLTLRHVGDLTHKLPRLFKQALLRAEPFIRAFADSYSVALTKPRGEILQQVGKKYALPERSLAAAAQLWDADGDMGAGNTLAGLVNALTRASQQETMAVALDIEKAAGQLAVVGL